MARFDGIAPRAAQAAAGLVMAVMAASVPIKSASAWNDDLRYHRN